MTHTELRQRARAILAGTECVSPASVYDAVSAKVASLVGFKLGLFSGSMASAAVLPAPDIVLVTLTEFADQIRRIVRAGDLTLLVDADHGYGNALNVMRTIEETEHAGVSVIGIEDLAQPAVFGEDGLKPVSIPEMVGKLKAALAARRDPSLVIAARTASVRTEGVEGLLARVKAYEAAGVDAHFVVGFEDPSVIEAVHAVTKLPIVVGSGGAPDERKRLQAAGVRIMLQGHQPLSATIKALQETYEHLYRGGDPAALKPRIASADELGRVTGREEYARRRRDYLK